VPQVVRQRTPKNILPGIANGVLERKATGKGNLVDKRSKRETQKAETKNKENEGAGSHI